MMSDAAKYDSRLLRLMRLGALELRAGGWRFGTKRIADQVVQRLVATGRTRRDGDRLRLVIPGEQP